MTGQELNNAFCDIISYGCIERSCSSCEALIKCNELFEIKQYKQGDAVGGKITHWMLLPETPNNEK